MENAAKGLIMAGGILLAVIVLSVGVYIFTTFRDGTEPYNQTLTEQEIWAFNNKFLDCIHYNEETACYESTIQDIVTMINLAIATENDEIPVLVILDKPGIDEEYGCTLEGTGVKGASSENLINKLQDDITNYPKKKYTVTRIDKYTVDDSNPYIVGAIKQITINFN